MYLFPWLCQYIKVITPDFFDRALSSITDEQTIKPNEIVLVVDGPVSNEINKCY